MAACPYCRALNEENDLFCRSCGASLRIPEYDRAFCPHCGARVGIRQEFCHECHWSLVKPAGAVPASLPGKPAPWKRPWVWAVFVGAGVIIALLPWLFTAGPSPSPAPETQPPKITEEKTPIMPPAPAAPAAPGPKAAEGEVIPPSAPTSPQVLKKELEELLNQLREAQLKKDIFHYIQVFLPNFPDLETRRQKTLAVWQAYDYTGLDFELDDVKLLDGDHAEAKVIWNLKLQAKASQTGRTETQTYRVWFSKDAGKWRVNKLEMVRKQD
jgi:hypothetical protein